MRDTLVHKARSGATRQAEYAARKRAEGYKQRVLWLKEEEFIQVEKLLSKLRCGDSYEW
jgi:hypothetical protein